MGQALTLEEIKTELLSDLIFFQNSGGGVTISGGEPLFFADFTLLLARELKEKGVHIAIETCCFHRWEVIERLLDFVDLFIVDIKTLNEKKHKKIIGGTLPPILNNIERLLDAGASVRIHLPLIPGFNDSLQDFEAYISYIGERVSKFEGVDILPYHSFGEGKYTQLGMKKIEGFESIKDIEIEEVLPFARAIKKLGIKSVTVGGMTGVGKKMNVVNA